MSFLNRYILQISGALIAVIYLVAGVFKSTNSTASIGFLFIPVAILIGAFIGDTLKYLLDVVQKKRSHSLGKTVFILIVLSICTYKFIQTQVHERNLRIAGSPSLSGVEMLKLVQKNDAQITRALATNPSLPLTELEKIIDRHLHDYYIMSGVIQNPGLSLEKIELIFSLERRDFAGDAEYEVYQTSVWAPLVKHRDISEPLIHKLANKETIGHFLILALLKSPYTSCDEKQQFLPKENKVLEDAILQSMKDQQCAQ